MSDKNLCSAVRDLLPLYPDGVLSSDTELFIKEHLENCTACQLFYLNQIEKKGQNNQSPIPDVNEDAVSAVSPENTHLPELKERQRYKKIAIKIKRRRIAFSCGAVALFILVFIISVSMFQYAVVSGRCMEPTIFDGEKYVVNKWSYVMQSPKRRDIIVYERNGIYYLTRIAGLPGELTEIRDGILYIDNQPIQTDINADMRSDTKTNFNNGIEADMELTMEPIIEFPTSYMLGPKKLAEDEYLVIPDNLSENGDSVHYIKGSEITGKVIITH